MLRSLAIPLLLIAALATRIPVAEAVPITGGGGPGGIGSLGVAGQGPILWLNADDITGVSDGNLVPAWVDSSLSGNNAVAGGGSTNFYSTTSFTRNSHPLVRLPNVAPTSTQFTVAGLAARTFVAAVSVDGIFDCCDGLFGEISSDNGLRVHPGPNYAVTGPIGNAGVEISGGPTGGNSFGSFGTFHSMIARSNAVVGHTSFGIGQYYAVTPITPSTGARALRGVLGEVAAYSQDLNAAQRLILHSYYGAKYDFAVTDDKYQGDSGLLGNYDSDVFGVGRLNAGNIYNDADGGGAGTGSGSAGLGIAATSSLDDGDFVLAGHRTPTNSLTNLTNGGQRWERVWYVDDTSVVGDGADVLLSFDYSDAGLGAPSGSDEFFLLFASNSALDFSRMEVPGFVSGDTISFSVSSALLVDGYYTLGVNLPPVPEPGTGMLFGLGVLGLGWRVRRRVQQG